MIPKVASLAAVLLGASVLVGWMANSAVLLSLRPGLTPMNPASALCFVLAGASLWLLAGSRPGERRRRIGQAIGLTIACFGLLRVAGYLFTRDVGFDQLLFGDRLALVPSSPNRMAPNTALSFVLIGLALALVDWKTRRGRHPAEGLTLVAAVFSLFVLTGYSYGESAFMGLGPFIPMALNTALGFAILCIGILSTGFTGGVVEVLASRGAGGISARRLILAGVAVPWFIGFLRLRGEEAGLYETELGVSLFAVATMLMFAAAAWSTARTLDNMEKRRQRVEAALREHESRTRAILDNATAVIYLKDLDGRYLFVNRRFGEIFHLSEDEAIGKTDFDLFTREFAEEYRANDREVIATRSPREVEECARQDGELHTYVSLKFPLLDESGAPYALCGISTDITLRKRIEGTLGERTAEAEAASADLEALSYSVSHDLRAPLRAIEGYGRILLDDHAGRLDDEGHRVLGVIRDNARHMGKLIDDLLSFSRTGRKELERAPIDMTAIVESVARDIAARNPDRRVRLSIEPLPPAQGDASLVRQVVMNLLQNAWKFTRDTPDPGIEIGAVPRGAMVTYFVRDNGVGFEMKYAAKLFGVFQRLHRAEEFEGTGVGLAIVDRIVKRHGGRVSAEGAPGEGATFCFSLPAEEGRADVVSGS